MGGRNWNIRLYFRKLVRHFEHSLKNIEKFPVPMEESNYLDRKVQGHKSFYKILSFFSFFFFFFLLIPSYLKHLPSDIVVKFSYAT